MGEPPTQVIADWVEESVIVDEWQPIDDVIYGALRVKLSSWPDERCWDLAEQSRPFIIKILRERIDQAWVDGATITFKIDEEDPPYIKSTGSYRSDLLQKLKRINPFDFEEVCARILKEVGCESEKTQRTRDGGIDFVATGLDVLPPQMNCPLGCRAAVIGQAKRYETNRIAEKALREFVGASLVRRHELRVERKIWPLSPVILAFWTTSTFDPSGRDFARAAGIWLMDGVTISEVIDQLSLSDWIFSLPDDREQTAPP